MGGAGGLINCFISSVILSLSLRRSNTLQFKRSLPESIYTESNCWHTAEDDMSLVILCSDVLIMSSALTSKSSHHSVLLRLGISVFAILAAR